MTEIWKPITWIKGICSYSVSNHGRVRRDSAGPWKGPRGVKGFVLKQKRSANGYMSIGLHQPAKRRQIHIHVHRLVAIAFIGPCPKGLHVNHLDGDKANNVAANLRYVTPSENVLHAYRTGLVKPARGERHGLAALNDDAVRAIRLLHEEHAWSVAALARAFRTDTKRINLILRGEIWSSVPAILFGNADVRTRP